MISSLCNLDYGPYYMNHTVYRVGHENRGLRSQNLRNPEGFGTITFITWSKSRETI